MIDHAVRSHRRVVGLRLLGLARAIGPALTALRSATVADTPETCEAAALACDRVAAELKGCLDAIDALRHTLDVPRSSRTMARAVPRPSVSVDEPAVLEAVG